MEVTHNGSSGRRLARQRDARGFSLIEMVVVVMVALIISAIAIMRILPNLQNSRSDVAMAEVEEVLRQAREYSIQNRRYVQVAFKTVVVGSQSQAQITTTQINSLTANAGSNVVLSTVTIEEPVQFFLFSGVIDTPDAFGNGGAIYFESESGGPSGGMYFQNDGELVDGTTYQAINGTVFLGVSSLTNTSTRAVTVLGATGRIRAWKFNGSGWSQQ